MQARLFPPTVSRNPNTASRGPREKSEEKRSEDKTRQGEKSDIRAKRREKIERANIREDMRIEEER